VKALNSFITEFDTTPRVNREAAVIALKIYIEIVIVTALSLYLTSHSAYE